MSRLLKRQTKDSISAQPAAPSGGARKLSKDALGRLGKLMGGGGSKAPPDQTPQTYSLKPAAAAARPGSGPVPSSQAAQVQAQAQAQVQAQVKTQAQAQAQAQASASRSGAVAASAAKAGAADQRAASASRFGRVPSRGPRVKVDVRRRGIEDQLKQALAVSCTHACYRHDIPRYQAVLSEAVETRGRSRSVLAARAKASVKPAGTGAGAGAGASRSAPRRPAPASVTRSGKTIVLPKK